MNWEDHSMFWLLAYEILVTELFTFRHSYSQLKNMGKPWNDNGFWHFRVSPSVPPNHCKMGRGG
jgi:hypothetical protein